MTSRTTQRMVIEEITEMDGPHIQRLMNSPGWLRFIGDRNIRTIDDALTYINDRMLIQYRSHNFGLYKMSTIENNDFIGICGLVQRPNLPKPDLGFAMMPEFEGKGLMEEAACCILQYIGQSNLASECWAMTDPENFKAQKLLDKLGFIYDPAITKEYAKDGLLYYKLGLKISA